MFEAAAPDEAYDLTTIAELAPLDDLQRARLERLRAQIAFARRRGADAPVLLLDAARRLEPLDPALARETYLDALGALIFAGRLSSSPTLREVAEAAQAAPPGPDPPRPLDLLLDGVATRFTGGYVASVAPIRRALDAFREDSLPRQEDVVRWLLLAYTVQTAAHELWDDDAWHDLATRTVGLAREAGELAVLPVALGHRAGVHLHAGEFAAASALIAEADDITAATGNAQVPYASLVLAAWRGDEARALGLIEACVRDATIRGEGRVLGMAAHATAVLYNGLGRYDAALAGARRACEDEDLGFFGWSLVELVEAATRRGDVDGAAGALGRLEERTRAAGTDWALGLAARSRALLVDGDRAEALYREAIDKLGRGRIVVHLARGHLLYGEWLRREHRRVEAREQLRVAYDMLSRIGAEAFAERARRELLATGANVHKRTVEARHMLTAQEAQVAAPRRRTPHQLRDRGPALHQPSHRRVPPEQGVHEARHRLPSRARERCSGDQDRAVLST